MLARRFGVRNIERIEDAVQSALERAFTSWTIRGHPDRPGAWLYQVAQNELLGELRKETGRSRILESARQVLTGAADVQSEPLFDSEIRDDMLRMLFVCCDESIPRESRLVLALKVLCGFSTGEIASRLFTTEANILKRLSRGRERLRSMSPALETPEPDSLNLRLSSVQEVLYLLFNEGYLSQHAELPIRRELCEEAVRLATLLSEHSVGARPETYALLALMHFHAARLAARLDDSGGLLLLEEQDRSAWDQERIAAGAEWLARSASGDVFSRFHAEAGIAAEHCFARSFAETNWAEIADFYAILERIAPSPLHTLNKAVALAEWRGPEAGLAALEGIHLPTWLEGFFLWDAVVSDLYRRTGDIERARHHGLRAVSSAPTELVREPLRRRLRLPAG